MVKSAPALDVVFHALSDPTRRAIVERLGDGDRTIADLAEEFPMSLPAVSKHLTVLERAGLVRRERVGRSRRCRLVATPLAPATEWLATRTKTWERRLGALAALVEKEDL